MNASLPLALSGAVVLIASALGGSARADAAHPQVIELFTSQGCSTCPPAHAAFLPLAARPDVLALSFHVTYWDELGWKDTFSQRGFTQRQWDYAHAFRRPNVATPQTVVNGRIDAPGGRPGEMEELLRRGARTGGPEVQVDSGSVSIGAAAAPAQRADVWLVRYDPRVLPVPIRAGENRGVTLNDRNVVRELEKIGSWNGAAETLRLPPPRLPGLSTAILVQAGSGGPIIAAGKS